MDVVLVNPPQPELNQPAAYIPLGLAYIAAKLEKKGFSVEIVNLAKDPDKLIPDADWLGITCNSATFEHVDKLMKGLRNYPGKVVIGGPHATIMPEDVRQILQPDVVIRGEAEILFARLVAGTRLLKPIMDAGIIKHLDGLPFPARHLFDEDCVVDYSGIHGQEKGAPATTVLSSRGCPYRCKFCCKGHKMFEVHRCRSSGNVRLELEQLIELYEIEHVRFVDDEFAINRMHTIRLCKTIQNLCLTWVCITRADSLDAELLANMKLAGCVEVHVGIESGSDRLLRLMNKQTTAAELLKGIRLIKAAGIRVKTYLMYNFPGETEFDRGATLHFLAEAKPDKFTLSRFSALPGSRMAGLTPGRSWFYPDESDQNYIKYKNQIREVIEND